MQKTHNSLHLITLSGVFSALIFISTALMPRIPVANGYIHIGDVFIFICASILPKKYSALSSALGAGLADLIGGYTIWIPATIIIKACMTLVFSSGNKIINKKNIIACIIAMPISVVGYYFYEAVITKNFVVPITSVPFNLLQAVGSSAIFIVIGLTFDKIRISKSNK